MWSNITKLWGNNIKNDNLTDLIDINAYIKHDTDNMLSEIPNNTSCCILDDNSPRDTVDETYPVKLWPHQEAMLHRIRYIENQNYQSKTENTFELQSRYMNKEYAYNTHNVCLGVMNDPPGSGKTYAILTAIKLDKTANKGVSIIIVPQNIYNQWADAIRLLFEKSEYNLIKSYADVMDIYSNPNDVNKYKVSLIQDSFADSYLKTINDNKLSLYRVIVDEVDSMDKYINTSIKTQIVWLISASYTNQDKLGPYNISDRSKVVFKCSPEFVAKSINLPEPKTEVITCNDEHIHMFKNILKPKEMTALKSGDLTILNRLMNKTGIVTIDSMKDTIKKYVEYLYKKSEGLEEAEQEYDRILNSDSDEVDGAHFNLLRNEISKLKQLRENSKILSDKLETLGDIIKSKEYYLQEELKDKILNNKDSKWLFFNDNSNVLIRYQDFLTKVGIKSLMLDGGNQYMIAKYLNDYRNGDVQVLLLNSIVEGAGMNLENTDNLVFMHKTEDKFVQQVLGRAQRYGRKTPLNIIMLFNTHE